MTRKFAQLLAAVTATTMLSSPAAAKEVERPNFLVIVADDLGFSDLGAFGGEISTPNLDALALSGMRLTGFHTAPACSPTRAMLLTGSDSHRVGLGAMSELTQENQRGKPGYEGYLRADTATLAERLSAGGYRTFISGKWHLGIRPEQDPHARGFQHSFSLAQGGGNHFGLGLSSGSDGEGSIYRENGVAVTSLPADFYSTDYFADKLVQQIRTTKAGPDGQKPFFAYLAFTAPHFPLQAPPATITKYKGRYDEGFEVLREERLKRQRELGLLSHDVRPHPFVDTPRWKEISVDQRKVDAREMEIYAAMVDRMDEAIGRVIAALKDTGELDNTVVLFLSDNGSEGMEVSRSVVPGLSAAASAAASDLDTMGAANTYLSYGNGWAQAASAPSSRQKGYATEGGTRVAAFLSGPVVRQPGSISETYLNVMDVTPTLLDLAGVQVEPGRFAGRTVQPIDGLSWDHFLKHGTPVYSPDKPVATELFGSRSVRMGNWKITDISDGRWRLYNIPTDPGETRDLAKKYPDRQATLINAWDEYAKTTGVIIADPVIHSNPPHSID